MDLGCHYDLRTSIGTSGPQKFPLPGLAFGQAGLWTTRGKVVYFIRQNRYRKRNDAEAPVE